MFINSSSAAPYVYPSPFMNPQSSNSVETTNSTPVPSSGPLMNSYSLLSNGVTTSMFSYLNNNLSGSNPLSSVVPSTIPSVDMNTLQNESGTVSSMMGEDILIPSFLDGSLMNTYDQLTSGGLTSNMFSYMNSSLNMPQLGSVPPSTNALYSANLLQQTYLQSSQFLQSYNAVGQQLNVAA